MLIRVLNIMLQLFHGIMQGKGIPYEGNYQTFLDKKTERLRQAPRRRTTTTTNNNNNQSLSLLNFPQKFEGLNCQSTT